MLTTIISRRHFLALLGGMGMSGCLRGPMLFNPCLPARLPESLANHELVRQAFDGLRPGYIWDGHVHLLGTGDSGSGAWINPQLRSLWHPVQYTQLRFYLNASCAAEDNADESFLARLLALRKGFPPQSRFMVLAFDYSYDESGRRRPDLSAFHTPNELAARLHREYPGDFEWIASVHPYREDVVEALEQASKAGARAVKWLPPAMGMDPGAARCDAFYAALVRLGLPLLVHAGDEKAVHGSGRQDFGNPLLLRRPLEHGVKVIVAHCASLGQGRDLDKGADGPWVSNFSLFARLMNDHRFEGLLFGDISAVIQRNRRASVLKALLETDAWHGRLVNGSDYPLPGVVPLISLRKLRARGFLPEAVEPALNEVRLHNAILFDFMLKRLLHSGGKRFSPGIFESRRVYG
ncbi:MAG: amidohydrolase family protein [Gammaproteobacteria bacterium]|nr:amidohydrolase family protein [Gammaproteobacteria bacterium]